MTTGGLTVEITQLDAIREETQKLTDHDRDDSDYDGTPTDSPATGISSFTDHHAFVLGYRSADVDLGKCHPLPSHVTFLWSVYQENVEPLIKLLHIPTTDLILRDARKNSDKLSPGQEALAFSIYFAAVTSLEPEEVCICSHPSRPLSTSWKSLANGEPQANKAPSTPNASKTLECKKTKTLKLMYHADRDQLWRQ